MKIKDFKTKCHLGVPACLNSSVCEKNRKATNSKCLRSTRHIIVKLSFKSISLDSQHNILLDTSSHAVSWNDFTLTKYQRSFRIEQSMKCFGSKAIDEKLDSWSWSSKINVNGIYPSIGIIIVYIFFNW